MSDINIIDAEVARLLELEETEPTARTRAISVALAEKRKIVELEIKKGLLESRVKTQIVQELMASGVFNEDKYTVEIPADKLLEYMPEEMVKSALNQKTNKKRK